ncbi:MAG: alpha/beta fold hydrolase [Massilia sp.]
MHQLALPILLTMLLTLSGCSHEKLHHEFIKGAVPMAKSVVAAVEADTFIAASFTGSNGVTLPYRVLLPRQVEPGVRYPLVLQLHGSGGIGTDNLKQLDLLARTWAMPEIRDKYRSYVLVPQFPIRSANYGPPSPDQHAEHSAALTTALELVEKFAADNAVDRTRVYALGFSMGGSATWLAAALKPDLFAAIVPISGIAPDNDVAGLLKDMPIWAMHGNADSENPIGPDLRLTKAIRTIGGTRILFREYVGLDHLLHEDLYPGYWWRDWVFAQYR